MNHNLVLAPVIIALAFTLPSRAMCMAQVIAGVIYGMIGILKLRDKR